MRRGPSAVPAWSMALGVAAAMLTAPAFGQVIEIVPGAQAIVHSGPSVYVAPGQPSQSLAIKPEPAAQAAPRRGGPPPAVAAAIGEAASATGVSGDLLTAVAWQESRFRQDARSPKGAQGVMQLMPGTARDLNVVPSDLNGNVSGGARYLSDMLQTFGDDLPSALAAYNAGPGAVRRYGGAPPYAETKAYVAAIMERLAEQALQEPQP